MTSDLNHPSTPPPSSSDNSGIWKTIGLLILITLGVITVLLLGVIIGRAVGSNEAVPGDAPTVVPPADSPPDMEPTSPYLITTANVNVRTGPSTDYPSYGIAPQGSVFEVTGVSADMDWWVVAISINYAADGAGWISKDYVNAYHVENVPVIEAPQLPPDLPTYPTPAPDKATAITLEPLNVRSGPGNAYSSYGKAPRGTSFEIVGRNEDGRFWVVALPTTIAPDGQGWISAAYCDTENADNVPVVPAPPLP